MLNRAGATPVMFGYASALLAVLRGRRGERDAALARAAGGRSCSLRTGVIAHSS